MMKQALDAFIERVKTGFPDISEILRSWPGPETQADYPFMVLLVVNAELDRWQPFHVVDGNYHTGQWEVRFDLHYLSKEGESDNQIEVAEQMSSFFDGDLAEKGFVSLDVPFGTPAPGSTAKPYTANFRLLGFNFENQPNSISKGERRTIFTLEADIPQITQAKIVPLKSVEVDAKVAENPDDLN